MGYPIGGAGGPQEQYGLAVGGAGDVDDDGFDDFVVGAAGFNNHGLRTGTAWVISGRTAAVLYVFYGDHEYDEFGRSVAGAGDVNNDGYADIIVGAPGDDSNGFGSGMARVFSGFDGSVLLNVPGGSPGDGFGWSVDGAGDVDNDGFDDLIIGSPVTNYFISQSGSAVVVSGRTGEALYFYNGDHVGDQFGHSVSAAGDVNDDGFDDFIIGAPSYSLVEPDTFPGAAFLYSGINGALIRFYVGPSDDSYFGYSVDGAGDVNQDGYDDIIIGAPQASPNGFRSGQAFVYSGGDGTLRHVFSGEQPEEYLGHAVAGAGDVNGGGRSDLIVASINGTVHLYSGFNGDAIYTYHDSNHLNGFGYAVSGAGDMNNDDYADFVISAPYSVHNSEPSGLVIRYYSRFPFSPPCPGDTNYDNRVDVDDLNAILSNWQQQVGIGTPLDLAGIDGVVDVDDLNVVLSTWNLSCP